MIENEPEQRDPDTPAPSEGVRPDQPAEGTFPPGNPERDEEAVREGEDKLRQAGGGH